MDTTVISAAMLYNLLKQQYCDAGCLPKNLTQSVYESVFQSVPRFSHVHVYTTVLSISIPFQINSIRLRTILEVPNLVRD